MFSNIGKLTETELIAERDRLEKLLSGGDMAIADTHRLKAVREALANLNSLKNGMATKPDTVEAGEVSAGAAGSGRWLTPTGNAAADYQSRVAEGMTRYAKKNPSFASHQAAMDSHHTAGAAHRRAGNDERAKYHAQKATEHFNAAKKLAPAPAPEPEAVAPNNADTGEFTCPHCYETFNVSNSKEILAGENPTATCPACKKTFPITSEMTVNL